MAKRPTNRRDQNSKGRDVNLNVRRVQGLRFSNAAGPHMSGARYDRNHFRTLAQRGQWEDED